MAALSIGHYFICKKNPTQHFQRRTGSRFRIFLSSQSRRGLETRQENRREDMKLLQRLVAGINKFQNELKGTLSPKGQGDWRDVMLMSFSFAVYVYISQKIVCAYCAWMAMNKEPW